MTKAARRPPVVARRTLLGHLRNGGSGFQTRVEHAVEQIDHEADSQKERGQQEQLALHGNQVAVAHVGHKTVADAR